MHNVTLGKILSSENDHISAVPCRLAYHKFVFCLCEILVSSLEKPSTRTALRMSHGKTSDLYGNLSDWLPSTHAQRTNE